MPDAADVVQAYEAARRWIDGFSVPDSTAPGARVPIRDAHGVCLVLRLAGRVVASGSDASGDDFMLRRAAARALGEVLADPAVPALPREMVPSAGAALTLELEVAGRPIPLLARVEEEIAELLDPGVEGVAMRRAEALAMLFPAQMRISNSAGRAERLLSGLAPQVGLADLPLPELTRRFDVSIYHFPVTTLVQGSPRSPPAPTVRGERLVDEDRVSRQALAEMADGIAAHLAASMAPMDEPLGLMGTYRPAADRYDPLIAPPAEQALSAWALANCAAAPGLAPQSAQRMRELASRILHDLELVATGEDDALANPAACAAVVLCGLDLPGYLDGPPVSGFVSEALRRTSRAFTIEGGFAADAAMLPPHGRALVAWAMARLAAWGKAGVNSPTVRAAIESAWGSVPDHQHATLLPWIAWAEAEYAALGGGAGPLPHAVDLQGLRDLLDASRVGTTDRRAAADLHGGLLLSEGKRLLATAQTLRPAAYLAWIVREPRLTPAADSAAALGRVLATCRFVMQLSVRPDSTWSYANPSRALGGIRAALWDRDQPVAAQALALAMIAQTLSSLEHIAAQPPP